MVARSIHPFYTRFLVGIYILFTFVFWWLNRISGLQYRGDDALLLIVTLKPGEAWSKIPWAFTTPYTQGVFQFTFSLYATLPVQPSAVTRHGNTLSFEGNFGQESSRTVGEWYVFVPSNYWQSTRKWEDRPPQDIRRGRRWKAFLSRQTKNFLTCWWYGHVQVCTIVGHVAHVEGMV